MIIPLNEDQPFPRLSFEYGFDDREAYEAELRGWRSHVTVEFENGDNFPVFFYDPVALTQELQRGEQWEIPCVAEPGMIVVPSITLENMKAAVARLVGEGFFTHFQPILPEEAKKRMNPIGNESTN